MSGKLWSDRENDIVVASYFAMLKLQLAAAAFVKAEHNRAVGRELVERSHKSIEFKHQNISAILNEIGMPFLDGYWPASNYQASLVDAVERHLRAGTVVKNLMSEMDRVESEGYPPAAEDYLRRRVDVPKPLVREGPSAGVRRARLPLKFDFAERDAANRRLGDLGEQFALNAERQRLISEGRPDLAGAVEWSSKERGDGLGYDVRSFEPDGEELFVEVKTTNVASAAFHFLVTPNEVAASEDVGKSYRLFRLFAFHRDARFYVLPGPIPQSCVLASKLYSAQPK